MKRITILSALLALVVLAALAIVTTTSKHIVPAVYASTGCSDATLNGNYAVIQPAGLTTRAIPTGSEIVPWQFAGVGHFDGQGTFSLNYTAAVNNVVYTSQTAGGTYTVGSSGPNSECVGDITITSGDAVGTTANVYSVGSGAEVFGIITNQGNTATFDLKKQ